MNVKIRIFLPIRQGSVPAFNTPNGNPSFTGPV
jgi:hypothetical protein